MTDEANNDISIENSSFQSSPDQSNAFEHIQNEDFDHRNNQENQSDNELSFNNSNSLKSLSNDQQQTNEFNGQDQLNTFTPQGEEQQQQSSQVNHDDDQSNSSTPNEDQSSQRENGDDQSNSSTPNEEQSSELKNEEDQSNSSTPNEEQSTEVNNDEDQSLQLESEEDNEQQLKPQREIDDDEIPPAELPSERTEIRLSPRSSTNSINDDNRPLTQLEDPYGNHQEKREEQDEFSSSENSGNQTNNSSINENLLTEDKPLPNPTLSSFLPDVVINDQTLQDNLNVETNQISTESTEVNPQDFTTEDFPPLPKTEMPVHEIINDEDFPPLSSSSHTNDQQQQQIPQLSSEEQNEIEPPLDILKNKSLIKQILVKGEPNTRPTRSTMVTISYSLSLIDTLTSNSRVIEEISNEKYFVGERDLIPAIDVAILLMDRGERALVESDVRHCYGQQGCEEKQLPPVTSLNPYKMLIDIELHDWIQPIDIQLLSIEERIFWSDKKRLNGNFHYRRQDYKTSLECYQGASRYLDLELNPVSSSIDQNQINILVDKYIQVQNNVAQTYLLSQKYEECLNAVENVLKFDSKNVKALFRQGKALFELGKYQETIQTLKTFLQIQRANSNSTPNVDFDKANEMIQISENKLANYQKNEKEIYKRMFQPSTSNNQQQQTKPKNTKQIVDSNKNWLPYVALGAAAIAVIGYIAFTKYRKLS